ncbi:MAG TPA: dephospho-CoA kinase [Chitinophagaceae bacterium]|nr:dephospho-CoA kinase [Chitinophagaceae bacterium]
MLKIGLTGGIGSGKSTVAKIFEVLGIPVYYADTEAKRLMNINEKIKESIRQHFGEATYKNEDLDRKYLADIVFNNPEKLELLNALIHPVTIKDAEEWMQRQAAPYSIKEAALLFESGAAENLDFVIGVYAPQALRIKRVMKRDNLAQDEIVKRINRQVNEEMKMKLCDFVITNNEQELLIPQVLKLHQHFISLANSSL